MKQSRVDDDLGNCFDTDCNLCILLPLSMYYSFAYFFSVTSYLDLTESLSKPSFFLTTNSPDFDISYKLATLGCIISSIIFKTGNELASPVLVYVWCLISPQKVSGVLIFTFLGLSMHVSVIAHLCILVNNR